MQKAQAAAVRATTNKKTAGQAGRCEVLRVEAGRGLGRADIETLVAGTDDAAVTGERERGGPTP